MANEQEIKVPDIGGASDVDVIEILVQEGDEINKDTPLITLESDKASMEIPSPQAGIVGAIKVKIGDKISEGEVILMLATDLAPAEEHPQSAKSEIPKEKSSAPLEAIPAKPAEVVATELATVESKIKTTAVPVVNDDFKANDEVHAGPAVRRLARELGVNLADVQGSGRKSRISKEDVQQYVKSQLQNKGPAGASFGLPSAPSIDFSKFGAIEVKPLNKIKRLTGTNVHRSWITIPHVTQFDEADITELEAFRKAEVEHSNDKSYKLTILAFVCKVVSRALKVFPQFNTSLDAQGENLIYKQYCNIGVAVETPNGLVVPVIREADTLSVIDIAKEMARLSLKAREKGLMPVDMSGGCFTVSSLGGIGGTAFTPIVNSPEVAILGLSRSQIKPIFIAGEFKPRLILPLSLSYDHRVIDGAEAARFSRYISDGLSDIRRILL
jgi:pyruvate dehydrogenase E2 component (dihydrolipoamide acetyltransferase)